MLPLYKCPAGPAVCLDTFNNRSSLKQHTTRTKHGVSLHGSVTRAMAFALKNPVRFGKFLKPSPDDLEDEDLDGARTLKESEEPGI